MVDICTLYYGDSSLSFLVSPHTPFLSRHSLTYLPRTTVPVYSTPPCACNVTVRHGGVSAALDAPLPPRPLDTSCVIL